MELEQESVSSAVKEERDSVCREQAASLAPVSWRTTALPPPHPCSHMLKHSPGKLSSIDNGPPPPPPRGTQCGSELWLDADITSGVPFVSVGVASTWAPTVSDPVLRKALSNPRRTIQNLVLRQGRFYLPHRLEPSLFVRWGGTSHLFLWCWRRKRGRSTHLIA